MIKIVIFACFSGFCWADYDSPNADTDYYWKEYFNKEVPSDAIPGGYDKNGNVTYIGLVLHPGGKGLIGSTIYPGQYAISQVAYAGKTEAASIHVKNIQILCSNHHQCYNWIPMKSSDFYQVKGTIVRAGSEWGEDTYIGRAQHKGELSIGRLYRPESANSGLWVTDRVSGEYEQLPGGFEALVYSDECNMCKLNIDTPGNWQIDIQSL